MPTRTLVAAFLLTLAAAVALPSASAAPAGSPPVPPGPPGSVGVIPADLERQLELAKTESWVFTTAHVDGAPLRAYRDQGRKVTCYFWKQALSCVKD